MKILIAEDDFTSRTVLTAVLTKLGHEVEATVNGGEAWDVLRQPGAPRLVILDWMMPGMDGPEVIRRVRALQTDRQPYIIMLTAKSEKENIVTGLDAGADDYLAKPCEPEVLRARVDVGLRMVGTQDALALKIEELREAEERYRELSIVDDLTRLYNARHFHVQLKSEIERSNRYGQPLTLMLLDIDDFKAFNDAYGHVAGDHLLSQLGRIVKQCLRQTDSAYRYGGEEFTILLPMTTVAEGGVAAERIRTELKKKRFSPTPVSDVHVTVSIGLAQYRAKEDMEAFVHRADQLMYRGKKNGKDMVCCES
jgi:diguanylate cyclase (GGDEF)-like protein